MMSPHIVAERLQQQFIGALHIADVHSKTPPRPFMVLSIEFWGNDLFRVELLAPSGDREFLRVREGWLINFCT